ncbi:sensor histidine kinase [Aquiflexum gelatinilyticum]|uniref:histidine kinase n=1 Tax=Aquiflexum gelatinilyticum TaxID=2961943 RepID=A0A9X2P1U7_9BACT|nr:ATP-binding protein [Aquiflexum gelatinilyticum]MCR9014124.1 ATP-binding protein [Aquiflexum gelatinilyticum]MCS4433181.1 ATP-binding protein [Aquiflexum gelatinilyticum]
MLYLQNAALIFIAGVIAGIVFIVDFNTDLTIAVASMYCMVILYSWLLPGKYSTIFAALICTLLTIISAIHTDGIGRSDNELSKLNVIISLVVIWVCVILVFIAKSSFSSIEKINKQLSENAYKLFETVKELDVQKKELSEHKIQLEKLNTHLEVKNRELERFTSIASHDLQEPLRTIGNMNQLIKKKYYSTFDDQGKKILEYVSTATVRMINLIKGLLEFSRIGNKRELTDVDIHELVHMITLDFGMALKTVNGSIEVGELPVVQGNQVELRMLFQNLIGNGLKFNKPDVPPIVQVSFTESGSHYQFCIKDNGIGIDKDDYEKIFLIFQRLHSVEEYEGTGLGLAYCRKIVELHGGRIWVNSKKDVGSSFNFTIEKRK